MAPVWDAVSGDYESKTGWLRIHANAAGHRQSALRVLGLAEEKGGDVAGAAACWDAEALVEAIVAEGGAAATMRSAEDWSRLAQGASVAREPLIAWREHGGASRRAGAPIAGDHPLSGARVLDLTRVLAGPAATRFLAGWGARVLRIDPPHWEEMAAAQEMTLGKACAGLDLRVPADRAVFEQLIRDADLLVHGYRPGALDGLGYGGGAVRSLNPSLIDIGLNAYGWTGPWRGRRGFDSLVQMSCGIAAHGMDAAGASAPRPLPAQALDHGTGYIMAAAALAALKARDEAGRVLSARVSLARTAELLKPSRRDGAEGVGPLQPETPSDLAPERETTSWGAARRIRFPMSVAGRRPSWRRAASGLRSAPVVWPMG